MKINKLLNEVSISLNSFTFSILNIIYIFSLLLANILFWKSNYKLLQCFLLLSLTEIYNIKIINIFIKYFSLYVAIWLLIIKTYEIINFIILEKKINLEFITEIVLFIFYIFLFKLKFKVINTNKIFKIQKLIAFQLFVIIYINFLIIYLNHESIIYFFIFLLLQKLKIIINYKDYKRTKKISIILSNSLNIFKFYIYGWIYFYYGNNIKFLLIIIAICLINFLNIFKLFSYIHYQKNGQKKFNLKNKKDSYFFNYFKDLYKFILKNKFNKKNIDIVYYFINKKKKNIFIRIFRFIKLNIIIFFKIFYYKIIFISLKILEILFLYFLLKNFDFDKMSIFVVLTYFIYIIFFINLQLKYIYYLTFLIILHTIFILFYNYFYSIDTNLDLHYYFIIGLNINIFFKTFIDKYKNVINYYDIKIYLDENLFIDNKEKDILLFYCKIYNFLRKVFKYYLFYWIIDYILQNKVFFQIVFFLILFFMVIFNKNFENKLRKLFYTIILLNFIKIYLFLIIKYYYLFNLFNIFDDIKLSFLEYKLFLILILINCYYNMNKINTRKHEFCNKFLIGLNNFIKLTIDVFLYIFYKVIFYFLFIIILFFIIKKKENDLFDLIFFYLSLLMMFIKILSVVYFKKFIKKILIYLYIFYNTINYIYILLNWYLIENKLNKFDNYFLKNKFINFDKEDKKYYVYNCLITTIINFIYINLNKKKNLRLNFMKVKQKYKNKIMKYNIINRIYKFIKFIVIIMILFLKEYFIIFMIFTNQKNINYFNKLYLVFYFLNILFTFRSIIKLWRFYKFTLYLNKMIFVYENICFKFINYKFQLFDKKEYYIKDRILSKIYVKYLKKNIFQKLIKSSKSSMIIFYTIFFFELLILFTYYILNFTFNVKKNNFFFIFVEKIIKINGNQYIFKEKLLFLLKIIFFLLTEFIFFYILLKKHFKINVVKRDQIIRYNKSKIDFYINEIELINLENNNKINQEKKDKKKLKIENTKSKLKLIVNNELKTTKDLNEEKYDFTKNNIFNLDFSVEKKYLFYKINKNRLNYLKFIYEIIDLIKYVFSFIILSYFRYNKSYLIILNKINLFYYLHKKGLFFKNFIFLNVILFGILIVNIFLKDFIFSLENLKDVVIIKYIIFIKLVFIFLPILVYFILKNSYQETLLKKIYTSKYNNILYKYIDYKDWKVSDIYLLKFLREAYYLYIIDIYQISFIIFYLNKKFYIHLIIIIIWRYLFYNKKRNKNLNLLEKLIIYLQFFIILFKIDLEATEILINLIGFIILQKNKNKDFIKEKNEMIKFYKYNKKLNTINYFFKKNEDDFLKNIEDYNTKQNFENEKVNIDFRNHNKIDNLLNNSFLIFSKYNKLNKFFFKMKLKMYVKINYYKQISLNYSLLENYYLFINHIKFLVKNDLKEYEFNNNNFDKIDYYLKKYNDYKDDILKNYKNYKDSVENNINKLIEYKDSINSKDLIKKLNDKRKTLNIDNIVNNISKDLSNILANSKNINDEINNNNIVIDIKNNKKLIIKGINKISKGFLFYLKLLILMNLNSIIFLNFVIIILINGINLLKIIIILLIIFKIYSEKSLNLVQKWLIILIFYYIEVIVFYYWKNFIDLSDNIYFNFFIFSKNSEIVYVIILIEILYLLSKYYGFSNKNKMHIEIFPLTIYRVF